MWILNCITVSPLSSEHKNFYIVLPLRVNYIHRFNVILYFTSI